MARLGQTIPNDLLSSTQLTFIYLFFSFAFYIGGTRLFVAIEIIKSPDKTHVKH